MAKKAIGKTARPKRPRKRILCKHYCTESGEHMIIYRDGTWRWEWESADDLNVWKLAHSDLGPMFIYGDSEPNDPNMMWSTDWNSQDENEVKLANTIANALLDLEMEQILKQKDDNEQSKTDDRHS